MFDTFAQDSDYFNRDRVWMINFRVDGLKKLITELKAKGVEVEEKEKWNASSEIGIFTRVHDPEGNPIELWQPAQRT